MLQVIHLHDTIIPPACVHHVDNIITILTILKVANDDLCLCQPLMLHKQQNNSNLHASCSPMLQIQANINKQLNY